MSDVSRYTLMDTPINAPGRCWVSGSTVGPVVDTGVQIQFAQQGRLYLSVEVIRELAEVAGLLDNSPQSSDTAIVHAANEYNRGYSDAVKENIGGDLRGLVGALGRAADRLDGGGAGDPVEAVPGAPAEHDHADGSVDIDGSISGGSDDDGSPIVVDSVESILGSGFRAEHGAAAPVVAAAGQAERSAGHEGPDLVSAGTGDVADFRI